MTRMPSIVITSRFWSIVSSSWPIFSRAIPTSVTSFVAVLSRSSYGRRRAASRASKSSRRSTSAFDWASLALIASLATAPSTSASASTRLPIFFRTAWIARRVDSRSERTWVSEPSFRTRSTSLRIRRSSAMICLIIDQT